MGIDNFICGSYAINIKTKEETMRIITVSREFASGGRELGKRLAETLGFQYYDSEIINEIVRHTDYDAGFIDKVSDGEVSFNFHYGRSFGFTVNQPAIDVLAAQHKVISALSEKRDCVIVGRMGDIILEKKDPLKIFVYSDAAHKIARCRERGELHPDATDRQILRKCRQIDSGRRRTHDTFAPIRWGDRRGYNLMINTAGVDIADIVPGIAAYAEGFFKNFSGS